MADYGDYSSRTANTDTQAAETVRTQSPKTSNASDPKTAGVSLEILSKAQQNPEASPTRSLTDEHEVQANPSSDEAPASAKANSVSTPILNSTQTPAESHVAQELIQADLHRMNSIRTDSEQPSSRFNEMTEDDLNAALDAPEITNEEIDEILEKLDQFAAKKLAAQSELLKAKGETIDQTKKTIELGTSETEQSEIGKTIAIDDRAAAMEEIKGLVKINDDGTVSAVKPNEDISKLKLARFNEETGAFEVPSKYLKNFKTGEKSLRFKDDNGIITSREIKSLKALTKEEEAKIRGAFIALNPQVEVPEEKHSSDDHSTEFHPRSRESSTNTNTTLTATQRQQIRSERGSSTEVQASTGKSTSQINEERIKNFNKSIETKLKQIDNELKSQEITNTEIKRDYLNQAIKKTNVSYEDLQAIFEKQNTEYEELMGKIRQKSSGIEIPLATIKRFEDMVLKFDQVAKMVPTFKSTNKEIPEALMETVSLQTQVMKVITDMISTSGTNVRTGTGHEATTAASAI